MLHKASPMDTFAAGNARTGDWRCTSAFSERCNDYGNDFTIFCTDGLVGAVGLALCIRSVLRYGTGVRVEYGGSQG